MARYTINTDGTLKNPDGSNIGTLTAGTEAEQGYGKPDVTFKGILNSYVHRWIKVTSGPQSGKSGYFIIDKLI